MTNNTEILKNVLHQTKQEVAKVIIGHDHVIEQALIAIFSGHHALIEGVPGVAKTLLVRSLAHVLGCDFARIQFTPDLMPTDITGTNVFNLQKNMFSLLKGPIFTTFLLADEVNRAPAKTQSALLQAMQERTVTIDRKTYTLSSNFTVFATQNPIEYEGTYPLPEAQIDRFFFKLKINYPDQDQLHTIIDKTTRDYRPELKRILSADSIVAMQTLIKNVPIATHVKDYGIRLVLASHPDSDVAPQQTKQFVLYGASPRGAQSLVLAGKVLALIDGRFNVAVEDIRAAAKPALRHRVVLNIRGDTEGVDEDTIIEEILASVRP